MRYLTSFLLVATFVPGTAFADNGQVKSGPLPKWVTPSELMPVPENATGAAFVRRQDVAVHLDAKGEEQYSGIRLKIQQSSALDAGNIAISWNPATGAPIVHDIKVYRGTEVIDVLKKVSFEVLRREDQLEAARIDGILTAVLRVPDLRVGDEIEVSYTVQNADPTLGKHNSGMLFLGPTPPPGRYRLELSWDDGWKPQVKMAPDMASVAVKSGHAIYFRFDNPGVSTAPKDAPPRFQLTRTVDYSDFSDWADVSRLFDPLFTEAASLSPKSPLKQEASRIAADNPTALGRASAALKMVQQDIRYIYVGLNRGNLTPATADQTWGRRYGDCKAKTALLLALLGEMGIKAEPVLVNNSGTDDGLDQRLPSPRVFDHVLVRAHIGDTWYWLDGTLPPVAEPSITPALPYRWVLPLTKQGGTLEHIEWHPAKRPDKITLVDLDARAGFSEPAHVISTMIVRGVEGLLQDAQFASAPSDQLLAAFRQKLEGDTWQTIDDVKWHYDQKAQASVLTISGTWKLDWDDDGDGAHSLALPGGGFNPPDRRGRAAEQDQHLPYYNQPEYSCNVTTVRLPLKTQPGQWASKPSFDNHIFGKNYYRAFALHDGSIRMIRGFRTEREEIDAATVQRDNGRIAAFDNSMAWISYDPAGQQNPMPATADVPATNDIDWTGDNVPCLSATSRDQSFGAPGTISGTGN